MRSSSVRGWLTRATRAVERRADGQAVPHPDAVRDAHAEPHRQGFLVLFTLWLSAPDSGGSPRLGSGVRHEPHASIMRIATTASPVSGMEVREHIEQVEQTAQRWATNIVQLLTARWLCVNNQRMQVQPERVPQPKFCTRRRLQVHAADAARSQGRASPKGRVAARVAKAAEGDQSQGVILNGTRPRE